MSIIPINSTSVAVDTYSDLGTVLSNAGSEYTAVTTVYLAADIEMTATGINISTSRTEITLDGKDPFDPLGNTIHTVTDYNGSSVDYPIGVRSTGDGMKVTYQNLIWTGRHYFGVFFTPNSASYQNVSVTFINVNYTGPQMVYHRSGLCSFIDCTVNIVRAYSDPDEIGEVGRVEIGGKCTFTHTDPGETDAMFWFFYPPYYFNILPNAQVTFHTRWDVFYNEQTSQPVPITIGENAVFEIITDYNIFRTADRRAASVLVDRNAKFRIIRNRDYPGAATFYCDGEFRVNENGVVYMEASNNTGTSPLLTFYSGTPSLYLVNPRDFALYNNNRNSMYFRVSTNIYIYAQQINYWATATTPIENAGTLSDPADYTWRKDDGSFAWIRGSATSSASSFPESNFSAEELEDNPLTNLAIHNAPAFSAGNQPLKVNRISCDGYPVTGLTFPGSAVEVSYGTGPFSDISYADDNGFFSCISGIIIPEGESVTIRSNNLFLTTTQTMVAEAPGDLTLLDVPAEMPFILRNVVADVPVRLYGRDDTGWRLIVFDERVQSLPWYLYASISAPLTSTSDPSHTIPGALVFVDANNSVTELSATPVLVYTGEGNGGESLEIPVSWDAAKGILIQSVPHPYFNGEYYRAPIEWTLTDIEL